MTIPGEANPIFGVEVVGEGVTLGLADTTTPGATSTTAGPVRGY